ncbi:MAG: HlyD family efflux transporter periplasmic adaptor subunit [Pseudomonadota bacterium]
MTTSKRLSTLAAIVIGGAGLGTAEAGPLLTGVIEDVNAQTIEMPSLPGAWQRRIEWMAEEGTRVKAGDLVVKLDPGTLIAEEEQARTDLEKRRFTAARGVDELKLQVLDAEQLLAFETSNVALAELDAIIPEETIPRLDFERYQLALSIYQQSRTRAEQELENRRAALRDEQRQAALEIEQAERTYNRIRDALTATEIRADKAGFMIYAENPFTGRKIYPGDTLYAGLKIASVASRDDLQVRLWIHEADFREVEPGQRLEIAADAQGIETFPATISWRSSQAITREEWSDSGYFEAFAKPGVSLPAAIMPGMSVLAVSDLGESP